MDSPTPVSQAARARRTQGRMQAYPRAWSVMPERTIFGIHDIAKFMNQNSQVPIHWVRGFRLPAADGPDINRNPTWSRELLLVWCYVRNNVPARHMAELQQIMSGPRAQELIEAAATPFMVQPNWVDSPELFNSATGSHHGGERLANPSPRHSEP